MESAALPRGTTIVTSQSGQEHGVSPSGCAQFPRFLDLARS